MPSRTIHRTGGSLVLVATGIVVAVVIADRRSEGPAAWNRPPTSEGTTVLDLAEEATLPDIPRGAWTIHSRIHGAYDVAPAGDGWAVLDARRREVHILDAELRLLETLGRPGEGPGELHAPAAVAVSAEDLVGLVDLTGTTVDLFDMEGGFVDRVRPEPRLCPAAGIARDLLPHPGGGFVIDVDCTGMSGREWVIARVTLDGDATRLAATPLEDPPRVLAGGRGAALRDGRVWLVTADGCMRPLEEDAAGAAADAGTGPQRRLCLPAAEPVVIPDSLRKELRTVARARSGHRELELPSHFPPVLAVDWSPIGPVLAVPPDPDSGALAIVPSEGGLRRINGVGRAHPGRGALLLVRTFMEGTGFHAIPWSGLFSPGTFEPDPVPVIGSGPGNVP